MSLITVTDLFGLCFSSILSMTGQSKLHIFHHVDGSYSFFLFMSVVLRLKELMLPLFTHFLIPALAQLLG